MEKSEWRLLCLVVINKRCLIPSHPPDSMLHVDEDDDDDDVVGDDDDDVAGDADGDDDEDLIKL